MKIKHVQLRDFNLRDAKRFRVRPDIEVKWFQNQELKQNNETHASFIGNNKSEINNQLQVLSKNIMADRLRTVRGVPKCRIKLQAHPKRKSEMKEEIKEYF